MVCRDGGHNWFNFVRYQVARPMLRGAQQAAPGGGGALAKAAVAAGATAEAPGA